MKKLLIVLTFIAIVLSFHTFGEDKNPPSKAAKLKETIDSLLQIGPNEYFSKIDSYLGKIDKYILHRKGICDGDFSIVILEENSGEKVSKRRKLSRGERRLCLSELKNLRVLYVTNLFIARKKYLDYLHDVRIKQLIKIKEDVLKEIQRGSRKRR
ncbi:MAG: hypothetical protein KAG61_05625 [Bacteriovoracaceae bacterium]|nr:hypothetical protein [Bacteriovoracaceae bacterium]